MNKLKRRIAVAMCLMLTVTSGASYSFATEGDTPAQPENSGADTTTSVENATTPVENTEDTTSQPTTAPVAAPAAAETAKNYVGSVNMAGQYKGGSGLDAKRYDYTRADDKAFNNPTDKLGRGAEHEGDINHLRTNFVGWSDMPTVNFELAPGAKFYHQDDTIATAFPEGLNGGEKLYAVYVPLNLPSGMADFSWLFAKDRLGLNDPVNENTIALDKDIPADETLPDTNLYSTPDGDTVIDIYAKKDDVDDINEIVLKAKFTMNKRIAMLTELNPKGQTWLTHKVLTENYSENMNPLDANDATKGYTYVDLDVEIPEGIEIPEVLYLNFKSYTFRPLAVLDGQNNVMSIKNPTTGEDANFKSLLSNTSKDVTFGVVNTEGNRVFKIRNILRTNDEKIVNEARDGMSVADQIVKDMELVAVPSAEMNDTFGTSFSKKELNTKVLKISDDKARELAMTKGSQTIDIKGSIQGVARAMAGNVSAGFLGNIALRDSVSINKIDSNILKVGYTANVVIFDENHDGAPKGNDRITKYVAPEGALGDDFPENPTREGYIFSGWAQEDPSSEIPNFGKHIPVWNDMTVYAIWKKIYNITFEFKSDVEGKDLPTEVMEKLPETVGVLQGNKFTLTPDPNLESVETEDGTWTFVGWDKEKLTVQNEDGHFVGTWTFTKKEEPTTPEEPKKPNKPEESKKESKAPNTSDNRSVVGGSLLLLSSLAGVAIFRRKEDK